ncbi:MAG: putative toxin-antitoxin system toxin component, PIN family [Burkholderiales bacterium]|nr:putative toxin-antitoxin system toxin component, PIN family [Burkholderiales bacterium]
MRQLIEVIDPPPLAQPVCRDKDDDAVLALALAAQADMIVSGDDDLLSINLFEGIPILSPAQALHKILDAFALQRDCGIPNWGALGLAITHAHAGSAMARLA